MGRIKLGRTGLVVEKQGFGCLPIQRISKAEAVELLHRAYDHLLRHHRRHPAYLYFHCRKPECLYGRSAHTSHRSPKSG